MPDNLRPVQSDVNMRHGIIVGTVFLRRGTSGESPISEPLVFQRSLRNMWHAL